jgi:hypothetical protein
MQSQPAAQISAIIIALKEHLLSAMGALNEMNHYAG